MAGIWKVMRLGCFDGCFGGSMYYIWVRVDHETRVMRGCTLYSTLEKALMIAERHFSDKAYEIDFESDTVYVSEAAKAVANGGQYSLFGV